MKLFQSNMLDQTSGLLIHGVNCKGVMGSGIALAIRNTYPVVYEQYLTMPTGKKMLGKFDVVEISDAIHVGNCYTQENYGSDGAVYASEVAIRKSLRSAFIHASLAGLVLKSPMIGCGLGGLDWENQVKPIFEALNSQYPDVEVEIYYL